MKPLLFALQVYEGDLLQARKLADLLADIKDHTPNSATDAMVVYRRDCPRNFKLEAALEEAFAVVHTYRTSRREIGFPAGPNGMWCDLMHHLSTAHQRGLMGYEMVLTTEADAVPLVKDWEDQLVKAWHRENSTKRLCCAGHWLENGEHECGHINGNALFLPTVSALDVALIGCAGQRAWDTWHAPVFKQHGWADIPEIRSIYRKVAVTSKEIEPLLKQGCAWLHGVKDLSALVWARRAIVENNA